MFVNLQIGLVIEEAVSPGAHQAAFPL